MPTPTEVDLPSLLSVLGPVTTSASCETGADAGVDVPGMLFTSTLVVSFIPGSPAAVYRLPKIVRLTLPVVGSVPIVVFAGTLNWAIGNSGRGGMIGGGGVLV